MSRRVSRTASCMRVRACIGGGALPRRWSHDVTSTRSAHAHHARTCVQVWRGLIVPLYRSRDVMLAHAHEPRYLHRRGPAPVPASHLRVRTSRFLMDCTLALPCPPRARRIRSPARVAVSVLNQMAVDLREVRPRHPA